MGRITSFALFGGELTSDGISRLLSLPKYTSSGLLHLIMGGCELDSERCEMLADCLSSLPHLERLFLAHNPIGCDGAQQLA